MRFFIDSVTGNYLESERPPGPSDIECAQRPSLYHARGENWQTDPTNPAVMWVLYLPAYQAEKIAVIKLEANRRINNAYPLQFGKQTNMLKRGINLTRKRVMGETLTAGELEEETTLLAAGDWIDRVRAESQTVEDAIAAATTQAEVDAAVAAADWPTDAPPQWPL